MPRSESFFYVYAEFYTKNANFNVFLHFFLGTVAQRRGRLGTWPPVSATDTVTGAQTRFW